jgi:hypothetical protein
VWLTSKGPLLLLHNNKPVSQYAKVGGSAGETAYLDESIKSNATVMPMTGAGIWANHTRIVLTSLATIAGKNQSALYLDSGTASFNAVHMLNNRAKDAVLVFVKSSSTSEGDFSCAQDVNPLDLDFHISAASTTCVLATDSKVDFNSPARFINSVQERFVHYLACLHYGAAHAICSKDNMLCRHDLHSTISTLP